MAAHKLTVYGTLEGGRMAAHKLTVYGTLEGDWAARKLTVYGTAAKFVGSRLGLAQKLI